MLRELIPREFRLSDNNNNNNNIEETVAPPFGRVDFLGGFNIEFFWNV